MEMTIQGKQNDLPLPGSSLPPPLQLFIVNSVVNMASDKSKSKVDGISWLDECYGCAEELCNAQGNRFEFDECNGIDLQSAWLQDIISSKPTKLQPTVFIPDLLTASSSSQIVPSTSAWEEWE